MQTKLQQTQQPMGTTRTTKSGGREGSKARVQRRSLPDPAASAPGGSGGQQAVGGKKPRRVRPRPPSQPDYADNYDDDDQDDQDDQGQYEDGGGGSGYAGSGRPSTDWGVVVRQTVEATDTARWETSATAAAYR
jgi:hypothetical protein